VSLCLLEAPLSRSGIFPDWWIEFVPQLHIPAAQSVGCGGLQLAGAKERKKAKSIRAGSAAISSSPKNTEL